MSDIFENANLEIDPNDPQQIKKMFVQVLKLETKVSMLLELFIRMLIQNGLTPAAAKESMEQLYRFQAEEVFENSDLTADAHLKEILDKLGF